MDASQVCCSFVGFGEGSHSRHDTPAQDRIARTVGRPVRFIKKIIVKPCALCGLQNYVASSLQTPLDL